MQPLAHPRSPFPRVSFVLFSIDSIEGRKDSREGKEQWREWNTSNAFIFQGRNLCMTPPRWMPHAEMGSVPIVERYRFKNVAATIYEIPFVSEFDEEDRASNKGDLLQERRRSRNSSRETLSLLENSEEDESRAINLPFFSINVDSSRFVRGKSFDTSKRKQTPIPLRVKIDFSGRHTSFNILTRVLNSSGIN